MKIGEPVKLAIFDIDGTIFRSSLVLELVRELVAMNIFPKVAGLEFEKDYQRWLDRKGSYETYIMRVVDVEMRYLNGKTVVDLQKAVKHVLDAQKDRVYRFTRDLITKLKRQGYYMMTISGSPQDIVRPFAQYLGFQTSFGVVLAQERGHYLGHLEKSDSIRNKDVVLQRYLSETSLHVNLADSVAVGDTEGDISIMEMVGRPIAFNPNRRLLEHARRRGWRIVVERKDAIYDLKKFTTVNVK